MKILVATLALMGVTHWVVAQSSPTPGASPSPSASPNATPDATTTNAVNALSDGDVQEALTALKQNFLDPNALSQNAMDRAALLGLIEKLKPGVQFTSDLPAEKAAPAIPLRSEILPGSTGYLRVDWLYHSDLTALDAALADFSKQSIDSLILDLRAAPGQGDYQQAADLLGRFCPKGQELFSLKGGKAAPQIFTSSHDPLYQGMIVVLVDGDNGGAAEVVAAVLREQVRALVVGMPTSGRAVQYSSVDFSGMPGKKLPWSSLQIATAQVELPHAPSIYPKGVQPDIVVSLPADVKKTVLEAELKQGAAAYITDSPIARTSEHALVNGETPELDALEARQMGKVITTPPRDLVLQRAMDLITSIGIIDRRAH
ncbi:MAG: S41 family peptidase [Chthoniobacteraceae bacterium]